jgi:hypothetical protein
MIISLQGTGVQDAGRRLQACSSLQRRALVENQHKSKETGLDVMLGRTGAELLRTITNDATKKLDKRPRQDSQVQRAGLRWRVGLQAGFKNDWRSTREGGLSMLINVTFRSALTALLLE